MPAYKGHAHPGLLDSYQTMQLSREGHANIIGLYPIQCCRRVFHIAGVIITLSFNRVEMGAGIGLALGAGG